MQYICFLPFLKVCVNTAEGAVGNVSLENKNTIDKIPQFYYCDGQLGVNKLHVPLQTWTGHAAHTKSQGWEMKNQLLIFFKTIFQPLSQNDEMYKSAGSEVSSGIKTKSSRLSERSHQAKQCVFSH